MQIELAAVLALCNVAIIRWENSSLVDLVSIMLVMCAHSVQRVSSAQDQRLLMWQMENILLWAIIKLSLVLVF